MVENYYNLHLDLIDFWKNTLSRFLLKTIFPPNNIIANKILIIVGFKYKNIGFLKKIVSPPNTDMITALIRGT